ncbi:hypothetical protein BBK36DRAFT_1167889 [Trichoderma citrinoviride]|uniref:Uncharacterized protein n=1 Tax=Trichoderma citrinoviride TaxID=58853 RepID=A0A2T4BDS8_9HYPO|nr:hypothetical protein BBK36DRAFT_1167889 [Trichoderma citrinoviride]PTB67493.1 hypothetical protein BBK36DRAFT_1167889 [Trichoderma citrinoviride]
MAEHTSSNEPSPTDSAPDLLDLDDLIREVTNGAGKHSEAATKRPDGGRRGSNEDSRRGSISSSNSSNSSITSAKRRSIDHQSSIINTTQDQRRSSSSSSMDSNNKNITINNEASNSSKGDGSQPSNNNNNNNTASIPPLNNIAVAIFVPLPDGQALLSPPPAAIVPDTPSYFLEQLERLSAQEAAVRGNIETLYGLEYLRVRAETAAAYADADSTYDYFGATAAVRSAHDDRLRKDLDGMIDSMRKPDSGAGGLRDVVLPNMFVPITYEPLNSPREAAANDVLRFLGAAAAELGAFDGHVQTISDGIKREMQGAAARGMREKQDRMDTD